MAAGAAELGTQHIVTPIMTEYMITQQVLCYFSLGLMRLDLSSGFLAQLRPSSAHSTAGNKLEVAHRHWCLRLL